MTDKPLDAIGVTGNAGKHDFKMTDNSISAIAHIMPDGWIIFYILSNGSMIRVLEIDTNNKDVQEYVCYGIKLTQNYGETK